MRAFRFLLGALLCLVAFQAQAATTLLPPGMQCFLDASGAVAGGSINMYYPSTTTPKPTWQDSGQVVLNTQPIILDSNGCATIYGVGAYRQQLFDANGSLLFDKITTDTSAYNSTFWAGLAGGTANVITIVDTGFNATDGSVINFTALNTNTGATTINPSSFGAIGVVKDTTAGPIPLAGGEIISTNIISVVYRASDNAFHLLNPPIQSASGATSPLCGATGLKIANGGTPNSTLTITAAQAVMQNSIGLVINRSTISVTPNTSVGNITSTINGMDGESPGTSNWLYVWLIDNGASTASLLSSASGNGLGPVLPSGYIYKCRIGAVRVDSSGNLLRVLQYGNNTQYIVTATSNTTALPILVSGTAGTYSLTSPTLAAESISALVPPTAVEIFITVSSRFDGLTGPANMLLAPSSVYSGTNNGSNGSNGMIFPFWSGGSAAGATVRMLIESANIYVACDATGGVFAVLGWRDGGVNAN